MARHDLEDRMRATHGEEPIDLRLSRVLDAHSALFFEKYSDTLAAAGAAYRTELDSRRQSRPAEMGRQLEQLRRENDVLQSQVKQYEELLSEVQICEEVQQQSHSVYH